MQQQQQHNRTAAILDQRKSPQPARPLSRFGDAFCCPLGIFRVPAASQKHISCQTSSKELSRSPKTAPATKGIIFDSCFFLYFSESLLLWSFLSSPFLSLPFLSFYFVLISFFDYFFIFLFDFSVFLFFFIFHFLLFLFLLCFSCSFFFLFLYCFHFFFIFPLYFLFIPFSFVFAPFVPCLFPFFPLPFPRFFLFSLLVLFPFSCLAFPLFLPCLPIRAITRLDIRTATSI